MKRFHKLAFDVFAEKKFQTSQSYAESDQKSSKTFQKPEVGQNNFEQIQC